MAKLEDLKELAKGVDRNKVKNIQVIGNGNQAPTVTDEFYQMLLDDKLKTDEEYAQHFYNDHASNKAYYKLKERLNNRLINTIFFIDINKNNTLKIQKAYYKSYKNLNAIKILLGKNIRKPVLALSKKTIKESLHYGFTVITIEIARLFISYYSTLDIDKKQFKYYKKILKNQIKIYKKEIEVEDSTYSLAIHHFNRTILDVKKSKVFKKKFKRLKKIIDKYHSYRIISSGYLYIFLYLELSCKWNALITESDNFFQKIENHKNLLSHQLEGMALSRKIIGFFMLKNYRIALEIVQHSQKKFPKGTFNWFFVQDYKIRIKFHTTRFEEIDEILEEVYSSIDNNLNFKRWTECFTLHRAFLGYLKLIGKIRPNNSDNKHNSFRLQKFLNEVPNHSKDKKGSNITILILQVLFLLEDQKYDTLIDRAESLKVYTQRYLKGEGTYRSNCFIKMLLCLPAGNFERIAVERKAKKHVDRLLAMPIEKAKQSAELEVMPYEMLWEFVLESLDRKKK